MNDSLIQVGLPPHLETFVTKEVVTGGFRDAGDYLRSLIEAAHLRQKQHKDDFEELSREILLGVEEADQGKCTPLDIDAIKAEGRRRLALQ